jgi:hypothetical protein
MMKNHLSRNARRVHARLDLATMGFHQELAVVMDKGRIRPLTTSDISKDTELDECDVRRALDELDAAGLGERRAADSGKLRKGKVEIYSWAKPRTPKEEKRVCAHTENLRWIPDALKSLLAYANRCRYKLSDDLDEHARTLLLERGPEVARILEEADKTAARLLDEVCAKAPLYKEDKTDKTIYKEDPPPLPPPLPVNGHKPEVIDEEEEEEPLPNKQTQPADPPVVETLPAVIARDAEPVPSFDEFRAVYPGEVDPESKPAFVKLKPADKIACVQNLPRFIRCGQWQEAQYIPRASNFILKRQWEFDAPPGRGKRAQEKNDMQDLIDMARAMRGGSRGQR